MCSTGLGGSLAVPFWPRGSAFQADHGGGWGVLIARRGDRQSVGVAEGQGRTERPISDATSTRVITWRRDPAGGETRLWSVTAELFFPHVRVTPGGSAWPPLAARGGRRERARRRAGAMVDGRCYRARRWLKSCSGAGSVCGSLDASSMAADRRIPQRHRPAARGRLRSTCGSYCSPETGHPAESGDWNWSGISNGCSWPTAAVAHCRG